MTTDLDDQVKWPVPARWLQQHGLLAAAMKLGEFETITEEVLIADSPFFYLTISELKSLEHLWVSPEDEVA